ncbi:3-phosphoshikimate 1-carboxyvinyltransferase [Candidatus Pelagibacter sp.]|nr:3-phosphoshikimate 1-carboxyvinyltransferase [Candidatus Pelagibacter sp.]
MAQPILINKKINPFNKNIKVSGDKSLSIRFALLASQAIGVSKGYNLLKSDDVINTLHCLKKLGVKIKTNKKYCEIKGNGLNSFKYKNNLILNAGNSGTAARLISALLISSPNFIKIVGDQSLSKRDMKRIIDPLKSFGAKFKKNSGTLPIHIKGNQSLKPINYIEKRGSAQCKSAVMLAALSTPGITKLKCIPSRNHTELLFKYLKIPTKIKRINNFDYINIKGGQNFKSFNYKIPGDISSAAFFIVLALLSEKSNLMIKNINVNKTRSGIINVLNLMGAKIRLHKIKIYKGEKVADISVKSSKNLKAIICPIKFNTSSIDEMLLIFLVAARSKGTSYFKDLSELNKKESPRLKLGSKILNMMGIRTKLRNSSIKIYGQPNLEIKKELIIKDYLKDHRIFMMSVIAALTFGGKWKIHNPESIKTSFPSFLRIIKELGGKVN